MTESEFNDLVDETLDHIEACVDDAGGDIDCDFSGGILTLQFTNGSAMIFSRQTAVRELWLAAKSGGFHFAYDGAQWRCSKSGETLAQAVATCSADQGEGITLE